MDVNNNIDDEIRATIDSWFMAYSNRDAESLLSMVAPDDNIVFIGTDADEKKLGREALMEGLKRDFAQADSITIDLPWVSVSGSETMAWVAADYIYHVVVDAMQVEVKGRLTLVMEKRMDKWLIVHAHFSSPVESLEKVFPNTH